MDLCCPALIVRMEDTLRTTKRKQKTTTVLLNVFPASLDDGIKTIHKPVKFVKSADTPQTEASIIAHSANRTSKAFGGPSIFPLKVKKI